MSWLTTVRADGRPHVTPLVAVWLDDAIHFSTGPEEQKVELYTATRLTIDPDTRAERGYLDLLAGRLGLPDALLDHIDATVSAAKVQA